MSILLVQGFFFQRQMGLGLGVKPGVGTAVFVCESLGESMFAGVLEVDRSKCLPGCYEGVMDDHFGPSMITEAIFQPELSFKFKKQYHRRNDVIEYSFKYSKERHLYIGVYEGPAVGRGLATCLVTAVDESSFDTAVLQKFTGEKSVHEWPKTQHA